MERSEPFGGLLTLAGCHVYASRLLLAWTGLGVSVLGDE